MTICDLRMIIVDLIESIVIRINRQSNQSSILSNRFQYKRSILSDIKPPAACYF